MRTFRYIATDRAGRKRRGELYAASPKAAVETLVSRRLSPIKVTPAPDERAPRLRYKDVGQLAKEIARLVSAGVPLESGAKLAAQAQESKAARLALERASTRLAAGDRPGRAFAGFEGAPGRALSAIVAAGERSGRLADALSSAAPLFVATARFREKIVSLLLYPAVVAVTALSVLLVFLLVVVPSLRPVLEGLGEEIPTSARVLLSVSDSTPVVLSSLLIGLLAVILLAQIPALRKRMRRVSDNIALGPLGFGLSASIDTALFSRLFAALLKAGTPAGDAIEEASRAVSNSILASRLSAAAAEVRQGVALNEAMEQAFGSKNLIVQATRLSGQGGDFAGLISEAGLTLADRAETKLERMASLAGPLIIIALGAVVGLMVVALFSSLAALPDAATI